MLDNFRQTLLSFSKFLKSIFIFFVVLIFSISSMSCGSSSELSDSSSGDQSYLPAKLVKSLLGQNITGELTVYNSQDEEVHRVALEVNNNNGEVQAPIFDLLRGDRYAFVSIFYIGSIPFAAVF